MGEENQDVIQEQPVVYNISDMIIRYGVPQMDIMQYFMHAGLPYHKKADSYEFYENEICDWETNTKCISWNLNQFDTKYYDLETKKFLARSDYAEKMGLESARYARYLELKRRAEQAEEEESEEEDIAAKKRYHMDIIRLLLLAVVSVGSVALFCSNSIICAIAIIAAVLGAILLLFTFRGFRIVMALVVAIVIAVCIFLMIKIACMDMQNKYTHMEYRTMTEYTGGADTITTLGM